MNPLQNLDLSATLHLMTLNDRVRERFKDEKARKHLSERDLAGMLNWSQSKVAQKLSGRTPMTLDEFDALCFALSLSPTEAVRDRGLEFCADMTPTELRILEVYRAMPKDTRENFEQFFLYQTRIRVESRGITKSKPIIPRGRAR